MIAMEFLSRKSGLSAAAAAVAVAGAVAGWQAGDAGDTGQQIAELRDRIKNERSAQHEVQRWLELPPAHTTWDRLSEVVGGYAGVVLHPRGQDGHNWRGALAGEPRLIYALAHEVQSRHRLPVKFEAIQADAVAELGFIAYGSPN